MSSIACLKWLMLAVSQNILPLDSLCSCVHAPVWIYSVVAEFLEPASWESKADEHGIFMIEVRESHSLTSVILYRLKQIPGSTQAQGEEDLDSTTRWEKFQSHIGKGACGMRDIILIFSGKFSLSPRFSLHASLLGDHGDRLRGNKRKGAPHTRGVQAPIRFD